MPTPAHTTLARPPGDAPRRPVLRVLVATETRSYREALAAVLPELRPRLVVHAVEPAALDELVALRPTALVVCGRLTAAVRAHARAWLVLYPDGEDRAVVSVEGHERAIAHPELADVLAAADAALEVLDRPAA